MTKHHFENTDCFIKHGCRISSWDVVVSSGWVPSDLIKQSKIPNYPYYISPLNGYVNHVIWGGSYSQDSYSINGKPIEAHFEILFSRHPAKLLIFSLNINDQLVLEIEKFSFHLASKFQEWAGFVQQFAVIDIQNKILMMRNDELEYILYARNHSLTKHPFQGVSDKDLCRSFSDDAVDFANSVIDCTRKPHLKSEIFPFTLENCEHFRF